MAVAGNADVLAPRAAVHHVGTLLRDATEVRLETAPAATSASSPVAPPSARPGGHVDEFLLEHD